jgi:hypothetical protein
VKTMRMRDEPPGGVPVAGGRQVPVGDPNERRWPLEGSLLRLGAGFFFMVLAPVLIAAVGAPASLYLTLVVVVEVVSVGLGCLFAVRRVARYLRVPSFTEFDGLIIKKWDYEHNEVTYYCVAIDDGQRPAAWAFMVSRQLYLALPPGMRVHVLMNERRNRPIRVEVAESQDAVG